jgi:hypothetical protein
LVQPIDNSTPPTGSGAGGTGSGATDSSAIKTDGVKPDGDKSSGAKTDSAAPTANTTGDSKATTPEPAAPAAKAEEPAAGK